MKIVATLALLMAILQDPEPAERIRGWIEALQSETPEERDRATEELYRAGEPALEPLWEALKSPAGDELRLRMEKLITRIEREVRRKKFVGGNKVNGLKAAVTLEKEVYKVGEAIPLTVEVMNVDTKPREFVTVDTWEYALPEYGTNSSVSHARVVLRRLKGEGSDTYMMGTTETIEPPKKVPVTLESGESRVQIVAVVPEPRARLRPGEYEVSVVCFTKTKSLLAEAPEDLMSNAVKFRVE